MSNLNLFVILAVITILVSGCITTETVCNKPYYEYKSGECCLDENDNKICDKDEVEKGPEGLGATERTEESGESEVEIEKEKVSAIVSSVIDGDTIELKTGERVRLLGINTPEKGQPCYEQATNRLKELVVGKQVMLESDVVDKDQYSRMLRYIFVDDTHVNLIMVREGYAHVYIVQPNVNYEDDLYDAQASAVNEGGCMWKRPAGKDGENICDNRCIEIDQFHWNAQGEDCDNLNDEYVIFKNICSYSCDMTGWTVKDESSRDPYTFTAFVLESEKAVTLYTGCGTDNFEKLYWCSSGYTCSAIWNNGGDTLYLRNADDEIVLIKTYEGYD